MPSAGAVPSAAGAGVSALALSFLCFLSFLVASAGAAPSAAGAGVSALGGVVAAGAGFSGV